MILAETFSICLQSKLIETAFDEAIKRAEILSGASTNDDRLFDCSDLAVCGGAVSFKAHCLDQSSE